MIHQRNAGNPCYILSMHGRHEKNKASSSPLFFTEDYTAVLSFLFRLTKNKGKVCFSGDVINYDIHSRKLSVKKRPISVSV